MSTWSTPDASDPFVGLTVIPETGDSSDELPERRPGFWVRFLHQRWAMAGLVFLLIVIVAAIFAPWWHRMLPTPRTSTRSTRVRRRRTGSGPTTSAGTSSAG